MPRVHFVKKARKSHPGGIEPGDSYYWWKFRFGPRMTSKTYPRNSQLTRSAFLGNIYDLEDDLSAMKKEDLDVEEILDTLREMQEGCEESLWNMPDSLQETSESGMLLQERISNLEDWINDIEAMEDPTPEEILEANPGLG